MTEDSIIGALQERLGEGLLPPDGIGDDAALLPAARKVVTVDAMIESIHFDLRWSSWADVGFKLYARNASDVFAMGASPAEWLLALALPEHVTQRDVEALAEGLSEARTEARGGALIGGDSARTKGPATLTLTMFGTPGRSVWNRSGARPGQSLWLDGPVGWAAAGLHAFRTGKSAPEAFLRAHRRPSPNFTSASQATVTAAIDISDGLALDARRLACASGVSLHLDGPLPGYDELVAWSGSVELARQWQIGGGDDYVRLVAARRCPGDGWTRVGHVGPPPVALTLLGADGTRQALPATGYQHFVGNVP